MSGGQNRLSWKCRQCGVQFYGRRDHGKDRLYCSNECQWQSRVKADSSGNKSCSVCGTMKSAREFPPIKGRRQRAPDCLTCRSARQRAQRRARGLRKRPNGEGNPRLVRAEVGKLRVFARRIAYRWVSIARPLWGRPSDPVNSAMLARARYHFDDAYRAGQILKRHRRDQATLDACDGTLTPPVLLGLYARAKVCGYCGNKMRSNAKSLDHLVPISRGGVHGIENVEVVCLDCNLTKNASTALEFFMRKAA